MAKKISDLPVLNVPLSRNELFEISKNGVSYKVTFQQLLDYMEFYFNGISYSSSSSRSSSSSSKSSSSSSSSSFQFTWIEQTASPMYWSEDSPGSQSVLWDGTKFISSPNNGSYMNLLAVNNWNVGFRPTYMRVHISDTNCNIIDLFIDGSEGSYPKPGNILGLDGYIVIRSSNIGDIVSFNIYGQNGNYIFVDSIEFTGDEFSISSSSVSTSYSSSSSTSFVWQSIFNNEKWISGNESATSWDGTSWVNVEGFNPPMTILQPRPESSWHNGYIPTHMRLTVDTNENFVGATIVTEGDNINFGLQYTNDTGKYLYSLPIANDIVQLQVEAGNVINDEGYLKLEDIEFAGASYSSSLSSSSSASFEWSQYLDDAHWFLVGEWGTVWNDALNRWENESRPVVSLNTGMASWAVDLRPSRIRLQIETNAPEVLLRVRDINSNILIETPIVDQSGIYAFDLQWFDSDIRSLVVYSEVETPGTGFYLRILNIELSDVNI
jgi:hypothetical protein